MSIYKLVWLFALFLLYSGVVAAQTPQMAITGADEQLSANIRSHVTLPGEACDAPAAGLSRLLPTIRQRVVRAGRALGYYRMRHNVRFDTTESCWILLIDLTPGDRVEIADINISIQNDEVMFSSLLTNLPLASGEYLNQANYERIKTDLSALAVEQGFFDARFDNSQLRLDLEGNTVDIEIDFRPGERYRIGDIEIPELESLSPSFIAGFMETNPDEFYASSALLEMRNSLNNSLYFSEVTVTPALNRAQDNRIPIELGLQMKPRQVYSVGAGVTTDIGPRLRLNYEDRYLTREGHSLVSKAAASPIQQDIDIRYRIPLRKPASESLVFSGGLLSENTDNFDNDTSKLAATYNFINRFGWRQNYSLNYQHDDYQINDQHEVSDLLMPGTSLNRTKANDALYPTEGWRVFAQIRGASNSLLAPETFIQLNMAGKYITALGPGRVLLKGEVGSSLVDDVADLPVSIQYFSGGDQSVRGYKYQSLGPLNEDGEVTGGKHLLSAGIEYDFSIRPDWKMAVFVDAGNSFNSFSDYDLKKSAGIGLRWLSPIGPIRVDFASALDDDNKLRLHITMGPDL